MNLLAVLSLTAATVAPAQQSPRPVEPSVRLAPRYALEPIDLPELEDEIRNANATQIFSLEMVFEEPPTVAALQEFALRLAIPRIIAQIEVPASPQSPASPVHVGLGEVYATGRARLHTRCMALTMASHRRFLPLRNQPVDSWSVTGMTLHATADAVRLLMEGRDLPPTHVVDGRAVRNDIDWLRDATERQVAEPLHEAPGVGLPEQCQTLVAPIDAAILVPNGSSSLPRLIRQDGEDDRQFAYRTLAGLPGNVIVTMQLQLNYDATLQNLAELVRRFRIPGMSAELVPRNSDRRLINIAELSIHGAPLADQLLRMQCRFRLNSGTGSASEWRADWVSVSMAVSSAAVFLGDARFETVRVTGQFPASDIVRLEMYQKRAAVQPYKIPEQYAIPVGCERFFRR